MNNMKYTAFSLMLAALVLGIALPVGFIYLLDLMKYKIGIVNNDDKIEKYL